ncbi:hypothetical protein QBC47DRAFT_463314 [Echria macrotheca]|uniref:Uncharacterized protein n=1 Tax=Echria macrotheca TaxID=438768 RepID=A0AAJ0F6X5_9PEZI|nr:hypothetical protein QBC47DRAFT_463314 [Echria macrotheca]
MVARFSARALVLAMMTLSVVANPIDVNTSPLTAAVEAESSTITPCATVRCAAGTVCKVVERRARCVPDAALEQGEKCGARVVCAAGLTCCNASCGTCVPPGMMCTQQACVTEEEEEEQKPKPKPTPTRVPPHPLPTSTPPVDNIKTRCGPSVCAAGLECCNESCGICVAPGKGCTKQYCAPTGKKCGPKTCYAGEVCCNDSCGICTPPGGYCTMQFCA